jgi:hypothetical protein
MDDLDRATLLARLTRLTADDGAGRPLEARLCRAYLAILGGDGAAITLADHTADRITLCATDDLAARLEDLQEVLGEGPGSTAYRTEQITVADLRTEDSPWPLFAHAARSLPTRHILYAVPMRPWADGVIGVLTTHQPFRNLPEPERAQFLANAIGAALVRIAPDQDNLDADPWTARSGIHQATGMIAARLRVRTDDAMALLRAHAFAHNVTLAAVANDVINRRLQFPDDETA